MTTIRRNFIAACRDLEERSRALQDVDHKGLRGKLRELLVSKVLSGVIPPEVKIGTGQMVTATGKVSPETDIILYSPAVAPPLLFNEHSGVFPFESALYTIEVKSKLTKAELHESIANARKTSALNSLTTEHWRATGDANTIVARTVAQTPQPVMCLFALGSDLVTEKTGEFTRYLEVDEFAFAPDVRSAFGAICVVGRGYFYRSQNGWRFMQASDDYNEVAAFVSGMVNTLPQILAAKGRPSFGNYLMPDAEFTEYGPLSTP